jgi:hypothetical protein
MLSLARLAHLNAKAKTDCLRLTSIYGFQVKK